MPHPTSIRLTKQADQQLEILKRLGYGTTSAIIRLALDRLYRQAMKEQPTWLPEDPKS